MVYFAFLEFDVLRLIDLPDFSTEVNERLSEQMSGESHSVIHVNKLLDMLIDNASQYNGYI